MTPPEDRPLADADKRAWRAWAHATRQRLASDAAARAAADRRMLEHLAAWAPWQGARWALVYLAFGDECDPLGTRRPGVGPPLATTRTPIGPGALSVHVLDPATVERHPFGFVQPHAAAPRVELDEIDVALVPGLAFDRHGGRLGYGRGLYDRLLPTLGDAATTVGVAREGLIVPSLPVEAHDVDVDWLLSERGLWRAARRAPP